MLGDLRLSINMFRIFCLPLFRMGCINARLSSKTQNKAFVLAVRASFKKFCMLPRCTPNNLVECFLGDIDQYISKMLHKAVVKWR
jgi:hypothetical protein